jgi:heat-inducible transcriptional repressor
MSPSTGKRAPSTPPELSDRHRRVLGLLVREYIEHGEPVSSLWLASHSALGVSSATVRNILATLERLGFVHQPHTSAGRVPTDLGYRCYVDLLLQSRRPSRPVPGMEARLRQAGTLEDVLSDVSHELSRVSQHVGFALTPANQSTALQQIDFVALDASRVLVVLVAANSQVWHKVVSLDEAVSPADLQQAATYVNRTFAGHSLADIRQAVLERLQEDRALYDSLIARALRLASTTLEEVAPQSRLFVYGASSLLDEGLPEGSGLTMPALRTVLAMIEDKHRLVRLLTEYIEGPGLTVVIGAEHSTPDLRNFSLVCATYSDHGQTTTVGLIGPRRMKYSRAIATVDSIAQTVGRVLDPGGVDPARP